MLKHKYIRHIAVLLVVLYGIVGGHRCCCAIAHVSDESVVAVSCCSANHSHHDSDTDGGSTDCVFAAPLGHQHACEDGLSGVLAYLSSENDTSDFALNSHCVSTYVVFCTNFVFRSIETLLITPTLGVRLNILFEIFLI